jgi:hypothetical protein
MIPMLTARARIFGVGCAAVTLTLPLAACSGGQSVHEACLQTNIALSATRVALDTNLETEAQGAAQGGDIDLNEVYAETLAPGTEALERAQDDVSNNEVKVTLDRFAEEYQAYVTTIEEADLGTYAAFHQLDPDSDEYLQTVDDVEATSLALQDKITAHMESLHESSSALVDVCRE